MSETQRIDLHPAYILHTKPYRDTSLLIDVFSHEYGRLGMVARGVRGSRAQKKQALQPFRRMLLSWQSKSDLGSLTQWETDGLPILLTGNSLMSGFYLNELILRLTHRHDPHPVIFEHYQSALQCLSESQEPEVCLRRFELALLNELGYGLILDHEANSGAMIEKDQLYCYYLEQGPVIDTGAGTSQCSGVRLHGETLLELASSEFASERSLKQAKQLMRTLLSRYLGDKPLKSREAFRQSLSAPGAGFNKQ
ncbi:MAG: DNA repair protein RecO [Gammaproteobacteria bacterium]|nr:DNA repair protein RecO [Gammaproteobacteria bacterium]